jgi:hypothetical protein
MSEFHDFDADLELPSSRRFPSVRRVLLPIGQQRIEHPAATYGPEGRHIVWRLSVDSTLLHIPNDPESPYA